MNDMEMIEINYRKKHSVDDSRNALINRIKKSIQNERLEFLQRRYSDMGPFHKYGAAGQAYREVIAHKNGRYGLD